VLLLLLKATNTLTLYNEYFSKVMTPAEVMMANYRYGKLVLYWHHGLSSRYDNGSHHHEWDLLWARRPIRERHIRW